ncbi:MAG: type IV pilus biogenesis/stability protein PilW [Colwellia sp.]
MYIINKYISKSAFSAFVILLTSSLLTGCVTQRFENNEPIVKNEANRDEMAATRISLGLGYLNMGNMSQAKLNLEKAKSFSPNLVQVHTAFAHYYETVGEETLAIKSFEKALSIEADSADTLNNYGVFLCRQGNITAAEVQFLKAIAVPSYLLVAQSYENLASCYLKKDDFEKAESYLNKAILHSPNRISTLLQMVRLQYAMGDNKEAKRYLQRFERNTQRFTADSLALSYKLYWKLGQHRTARNYANMLVDMYPQSWEGKQYLLNGLDNIAADDLAKRYQLSENQKNQQLSFVSNKRVVRLSPKKVSDTPYTESVQTGTTRPVTTPTVAVSASPRVVASATQTPLSSGVIVLTTVASEMDPTSTTPIAAKRDVPLPEPTIKPIAETVTTDIVVAKLDSEQERIIEQANLAAVEVAVVEKSEKIINDVEGQETKYATHTVEPGQNLYNISVKYNVKLKALRKWNNISEQSNLRIGDVLYVVAPETVRIIND